MSMLPRPKTRTRRDRCPGVLRPWPADDGLLVRLRLIGGRVASASLRALLGVAEEYGDGRVHVTVRANLQVRGLPGRGVAGERRARDSRARDGEALDPAALDPAVLAAIERTGLLPSRTHELARNVLVSPQTGLAGGRADLRPVAAGLDRLLCADGRLAGLPGRFLFALDDGRGDLLDRACDLGLVVLDAQDAQVRAGNGWGDVVPVSDAAAVLADLAARFLARRGDEPSSPWHVAELPAPLVPPGPADPRIPGAAGPLRYGPVPGGRHVAVPDGGLDRAAVDTLTAGVPEVILTPWRGVLVPGKDTQ